jgi:hypothetical protein
MLHKGIATLAAGLMLCFFLLSHFDPEFFFLHFYEALVYVVILLMLFYFHERWAYMLGIVAPAEWLLLMFITGGLTEFWTHVVNILRGPTLTDPPALVGALVSVLSLSMILLCWYRWRREFAGLGKGIRTFLVSLGIVSTYYLVLIFWFWKAVTAALSPR